MVSKTRYLRTGLNWRLEPTLIVWELFPVLSDTRLHALILPGLARLIDLGWAARRWEDSSLSWQAYWLCEYWIEVLRYDLKDDHKYTVLDLQALLLHRFGGRERFEYQFLPGLCDPQLAEYPSRRDGHRSGDACSDLYFAMVDYVVGRDV